MDVSADGNPIDEANQDTVDVIPDYQQQAVEEVVDHNVGEEGGEEEEAVVEWAEQQRMPLAGEPVCVVCGRYGAYVCDRTERDVCSKQCKEYNLWVVTCSNTTSTPIANNGTSNSNQASLQTTPSSNGGYDLHQMAYTPQYDDYYRQYYAHYYYHGLQQTQHQPHDVQQQQQQQPQQQSQQQKKRSMTSFGDLLVGVSSLEEQQRTELLEALQREGYEHPTPVQQQVIPAACAGHRDLIVSTPTGSGKTLSFLIPMIVRVWNRLSVSTNDATSSKTSLKAAGMILAPTRELCSQIEEQLKALVKGIQPFIRTVLLVGGEPLPQQLYRLNNVETHVIIATPGRLLHIASSLPDEKSEMKQLATLLMGIELLVIDEVDVMIDLGFRNQTEQIIRSLPSDESISHRQTLVFSATLPQQNDQFHKLLKDIGLQERLHEALEIRISNSSKPTSITTTSSSSSSSAPSTANSSFTTTNVRHTVLWVDAPQKRQKLWDILSDKKYVRPPLVIFVNTKKDADELASVITKRCEKNMLYVDPPFVLHGDKTQEERNSVLSAFLEECRASQHSSSSAALVATGGLIGRGIDLVNVTQVINYDMPRTVQEFVHQVGRAGRLGAEGWAITFINNNSKHLFEELIKFLKESSHRNNFIAKELLNSPYLKSTNEVEKKKHSNPNNKSKKGEQSSKKQRTFK